MTKRERIKAILNGEDVDRVGFWLGNPTDHTKKLYYEHFGITPDASDQDTKDSILLTNETGLADLQLHLTVGSDVMWYSPELDASSYRHPEGKPMFDALGGKPRISLDQPGLLADAQTVADVDAFPWPHPDYLDFHPTLERVLAAKEAGMAVFGGMWMPFFHVLSDLFGMEDYFVKMYTNPAVVHAATERILEFYLEANRRCLDNMGDHLDAVFFGNDLGSQLDLLISPDAFRRFIRPGYERIVGQAKQRDLKVVLHSCGAISRIMGDIIDVGIDGLHPLQAKARDMEAEKIAREYGGKLAFIGGVDTQDLLPFGTPSEVEADVKRLKELFGQRFVVSPSHEALLPNVDPSKVEAMCRAVGCAFG